MSDADLEALTRTVRAWTAQDPDPGTRREAEELVGRARQGDPEARAALEDAFGRRLAFGTAGLRGALGAGPNRMNRVVVGQAAAGLAAYLTAHDAAGQRVVVGYDARHGSAVFARDTAEVLAAAGFETLLTHAPTPTPVVAFGIRHLGCAAAVVVTASHNPPQDNGYKVYLGDGSQIVPPADAEIAAEIERVAATDLADVPRSDAYRVVGDELLDAYRARVASLVPPDAPRELSWVYTPMHGVGGSLVAQVVADAGFPAPRVVAAQAEPDPDFPTVGFPNPEEPGAIDLALAEAGVAATDLVVANDPDADRCAAATVVDGRWRMLSGDELGALLGDDALRRGVRGTYACSVVSSTLLSRLAAASAQPFVATLTGFKWIGRVPGLAFGYEEAIGYCVDPEAVPDKDGISALVRVLALAADLKAQGLTLVDRLDEIARVHGVHHTSQLSVRVADLGLIRDAMARLRAAPPATLAGEPVEVEDLAPGSAGLPPTDAVVLRGDATQVVVRPSGTEPKLKCYLEVREPPGTDVSTARRRAEDRMSRVRAEMSTVLGF
ncbi:phosphomannomutase [Friedmanniella luteola]|uniref:Phosphomannomutase n=1 Tax=Friedmanniella luteola TaxID=546871 RepID=A0A1H1YMP2_9ACTN|nr:phospho-sugar mutase [Friedmanniella luteola]SDT22660.1 phosphomannomutase [Friedmanniella luteola]